MRIAITGSSGLVGRELVEYLTGKGHEVTRVVRGRGRAGPGAIEWDPGSGRIDAAGLEGHHLVIHLAGEPILGLWTGSKRRKIVESRIQGTRLLAETLAGLEEPPELLLSASAVGYYGPEPDGAVDEESGPGEGFLAETVRAWEEAARGAAEGGVRVVNLRFGVILGEGGAVLGMALPWFRRGLGARVGSGRQIMSWIALSEIGHIVEHLAARREVEGPVNVVSPNPVSMAEFTRALARVVGRRAPFVIPELLVRLAGGAMAREAVLSSQRVRPARLIGSGYSFVLPELEDALREEISGHRVASNGFDK